MVSGTRHSLESFIAVLPVPAMLINGAGRVTHVNPAMEAAGIPLPDRGDNQLRLLAPDYWAALQGDPRWLRKQEAEVTRQTPYGPVHEKLWLRRLGTRSLMIVADETRLRELEAGHAQNARLASLGFLLASVSHEINNPLSAIGSIVQILQSKRGVSTEVRQKGIAQIADNAGDCSSSPGSSPALPASMIRCGCDSPSIRHSTRRFFSSSTTASARPSHWSISETSARSCSAIRASCSRSSSICS